MSKEKVREFYGGDDHYEFNRLVQDAFHRLELNTTLHFMDTYLPRTGHVLDAGGGPGRYTLELAQRGLSVTHMDLNPGYVAYAKRVVAEHDLSDKLVASTVGDICDLGEFQAGTFDAVLCLGGPLSHVVDAAEREKAVSELIRVAKPGAYIFCSVIGRLALLRTVLTDFPDEITMEIFQRYCDSGDYDGSNGFTACHFFLADDLRKAFDRPEVECITLVGLEGLSSANPKELNNLFEKDRAAFEIWWQAHLKFCTHQSVADTSQHFMIICRKK